MIAPFSSILSAAIGQKDLQNAKSGSKTVLFEKIKN